MAQTKRRPTRFFKNYCDWQWNGYAFVADGRTERADTELTERLKWLMIRHPRSEIWADTPKKTRQVIYLDVDGAVDETEKIIKQKKVSEANMFKALERTLELKLDDICENVLSELANGDKTIIWTLTRESVEIMTSALEKALSQKSVSAMVRNRRVRLWATHGDASIKARNDVCREFREHDGAGVIVATMNSLPESVSLAGAFTEHYAQLHFQAGPMVQSENRPFLMGTEKLHIMYYIAKGTIDERMITLLIPRIETQAALVDKEDAADISQSLRSHIKEESVEDFFARLTANIPEDGEVDRSDGAADLDVLG